MQARQVNSKTLYVPPPPVVKKRKAKSPLAVARKQWAKSRRKCKQKHQRRRAVSTKRDSPDYKRFRMQVLRRDGFKCVRCRETSNLHVHHCMVPYAENKARRLDVVNGVTLCCFCHAYLHPWMVQYLRKHFSADRIAFEIAQREYAWGPISQQKRVVL